MQHNIDLTNELFKAANFSGILMTDGDGIIIHVDENFNTDYEMTADMLLGRSVFDLEKEGVFKPSSAVMVLKTGKEVNVIQTLKGGQKVVVSAFPMFQKDGKISKVITFTRDIDQYLKVKNMYEEMALKIRQYEKTMDDIQYESIIIENFHTGNREFQHTLKALQSAAKYNINVLLLGETGVGKTLLAKRIHKLSEYHEGSFVEINCGALPENLIESELFGYEKGAFTGADEKGKKGLFEIAKHGTLFLDEVSELPLISQAKLLKVLQDNEFRRIGGSKSMKADCRIIAATNKDLSEEVKHGRFRQDLYYRLNAVTFTLPPLRERKEDIVALCDSILDKANERFSFNKVLDKEVIRIFLKYNWPGNVRELENVVFRMAVTSEDRIITKSYLPFEIIQAIGEENNSTQINQVSDLQKAVDEYEGEIIRTAYAQYGSSVKVAKALNISQATAARKIKKYMHI